MLLLKMGPEVPIRAQRALPAIHRSEKEGGRRPPELPRILKFTSQIVLYKYLIYTKKLHKDHSRLVRWRDSIQDSKTPKHQMF